MKIGYILVSYLAECADRLSVRIEQLMVDVGEIARVVAAGTASARRLGCIELWAISWQEGNLRPGRAMSDHLRFTRPQIPVCNRDGQRDVGYLACIGPLQRCTAGFILAEPGTHLTQYTFWNSDT